MSDLYNRYYEVYDKKRYSNKGDPDVVKMEAGLAFEEILEPALAARLFGSRPEEQVIRFDVDGARGTRHVTLYFSPDHIFFVDGESVLGEFKCTWYSSDGAPSHKKFKKWITQIMLYCHALNLNVARLYVLFINNDYKPPHPVLLAWELRFTDEELQEEWDIIMRNSYEEGLFDAEDKSQQRVRPSRSRKALPDNSRRIRRSRRG